LVAINPQSMKPAELMRVLNTAGRGTVLTETRLRRHRNRAGYTIGDARTVNLLQYAAWLTLEHFKPKEPPQDYAERKRRQAHRNAEAVRVAQDIGELPAVVDPERKAAAEESFRTFCETYFGEVFYLPWSADHLKVIAKIERAVRTGGLFAMAMPRGSGKTVGCQTAVLWAALPARIWIKRPILRPVRCAPSGWRPGRRGRSSTCWSPRPITRRRRWKTWASR